MAKITRFLQKIFAEDATNNGQFGSAQAGTYNITSDPETIQALTAFTNGWNDATMTSKNLPPIEEMQALDYIITKQLAYILQEGVVEYNEDTTYYENSIVKKIGTYELYGSLIDDNVGNALPDKVDDTNWKYLLDLSAVGGFSVTDITGQTEATIASGDSIIFSDVDDSGNLKRDTVDGIVDVVVGAARTYTGAQTQTKVTLTDAATITPDFSLGNNFDVVLGGNRTLGMPSNLVPDAAQSFNIDLIQDATGSRTLAYAWGYHFTGGTAPVLSTAGCSTDTLYGDVKVYKQSAVTITIATPAVVTYNAHGLVTGQRVQLTTTGALPTGLTANTSYYVIVNDANSFWLATTLANAAAGTKIATSGSQSGTHTLTACRINASLGIKGAA